MSSQPSAGLEPLSCCWTSVLCLWPGVAAVVECLNRHLITAFKALTLMALAACAETAFPVRACLQPTQGKKALQRRQRSYCRAGLQGGCPAVDAAPGHLPAWPTARRRDGTVPQSVTLRFRAKKYKMQDGRCQQLSLTACQHFQLTTTTCTMSPPKDNAALRAGLEVLLLQNLEEAEQRELEAQRRLARAQERLRIIEDRAAAAEAAYQQYEEEVDRDSTFMAYFLAMAVRPMGLPLALLHQEHSSPPRQRQRRRQRQPQSADR